MPIFLDLVAAQLKTIECNGTSLLLSWNASSLIREGLTGKILVRPIATVTVEFTCSDFGYGDIARIVTFAAKSRFQAIRLIDIAYGDFRL